ncbi:UDP-N-acetylmuramoyl-L-alanyl-D-glutamate--2,6-diaminopimelate ligase [Rhodohalobacter halophilus]|uniref:UDP-N-acetylmuramoyl-L-alanyl-D-glutamate--2, 6-diaminopimelate ligase n=1 Tax=Rhodohalobacter halophilus TaxID=1812810 RepID=UPI00083FCA3C|nr:UDP-N-acetylmuramoyl-L-alanyl-D-glutamate--2,6-diaminopimelate ligase [Rhodohalobacter halophilus]
MTFKELISFCKPISIQGDDPGTMGKLRLDSRKVEKGDLFIAIKGTQTDGHRYIGQAVKQGASVIISEEKVSQLNSEAILQVKSTRDLLSPLAQKFAGDPAKELTIIGITGTNGKTTVATLVWQLLKELNQNPALLGTVHKVIGDRVYDSRLTTADPTELATDMRQMVDEGCNFLVMEVSSHALHQKRVAGIDFEVAAFTNLSLDHLDYHKSMDEYADAKKILFDELPKSSWAIINGDDPYAQHMVADTKAKVIEFSFKGLGQVQASIIKMTAEQTVLSVNGTKFFSPLVGKFNAYNVVQALLIGTSLGYDGKLVADQLPSCRGAEGRLEKVNPNYLSANEPLVFVDYAHTPDALENVASTLSELKTKGQKLLIVFGCGGDRDTSKRPKMAEIAETYGDKILVTSDNPRTEDPLKIIKDIESGFSKSLTYQSIPSRREAIETAVLNHGSDTIILIAGKGHETYQEINGIRDHFDDREEARRALISRKKNANRLEVN